MINIFDFSSYRKFLSSWVNWARKSKKGNLTSLAKVAEVHPTFLSHALAGSKDLSLEQAVLISRYLELSALEQDYFFCLIQQERSGNSHLKSYWDAKIKGLFDERNNLVQRFRPHRELTLEEKSTFYSSWKYVAAWTATAINKGQTIEDLGMKLGIPRAELSDILNFLVVCGLCIEENGTFSIGDMHVHVPNQSPLVTKHHTNWRLQALNRLDNRTTRELFFTAPMSISKKDFNRIREMLNVFVKEAVEIAKDSTAEEVVGLNIDFFQVQKGS